MGDVVVTGYGVLSAFGFGGEAILDSVFAGVPGFRPAARFDTSRFRSSFAAESDVQLGQRQALLMCAREALAMAGLEGPLEAPVLVGTAGDHTGVSTFWRRRRGGLADPEPELLLDSVPGRLVAGLADELGARGRRLAFTNGCVASSCAILHGCALIGTGLAELALCGGCYLVEEEFFALFDAGRALSRDDRLRAFSADRSGLLLGDGAAVLVLESAERASRRGVRCLARVAGAMASDAHHVCQPHPAGLGLAAAMRSALAGAHVSPALLDYVNAHGTGTRLNDPAETRGIKLALGDEAARVPVSSTKSTTGHTLEAAGAVEAVISLLALEAGLIPPTVGLTVPDPECDLDYVGEGPRGAEVAHVLSLNSAFGGTNTALLFARP